MKFYAGQEFEYMGIKYRIRAGNRCDGDLVLDFIVTNNRFEWHTPAMAHTFILASFKHQVEENNYGENGKVQSGMGGQYFLDKIKSACETGWQSAADDVAKQAEKNKKTEHLVGLARIAIKRGIQFEFISGKWP